MPLLPVLLVAIVLAVDEGLRPIGAHWGLNAPMVISLAWTPVFIVVVACMLAVRHALKGMSRGDGPDSIFKAERFIRYTRWALVVNHAMVVLVFDWLGVVRSVTGDLVLIDELIAVLPPLVGLIGTWWAYYPVEVRLREALLIRNLDEGRPIYPDLSRSAYVLLQVRLHVLLMLVPILMIVSLRELVEIGAHTLVAQHARQWIEDVGVMSMAVAVFLLSPLMARWLLDVKPIAAGPLRDALRDVCDQHRVKTRDILLWNTNGTMFNAAVMGLIGPLRYVMITDALLETLPEPQVRAVMAHEVGHVRRHHMPWLVVCLLASFVVASAVVIGPLYVVDQLGGASLVRNEHVANGIALISTAAQFLLGLAIFGWISRRFERQADTFAVQHLSADLAKANADAIAASSAAARQPINIQPEAVHAMCSALQSIARLNSIDLDRPSWRHGSIAWRMAYLDSLVGRPARRLRIDRLVKWIKVASAVVLVGAVALELFVSMQSHERQVSVIPAKTGIQARGVAPWIPASAGMTIFNVGDQDA